MFDLCVSFALVIADGRQKSVSFAENYFDQYSTVIAEVRHGNSDLCLICCAPWTRSPVCYPRSNSNGKSTYHL